MIDNIFLPVSADVQRSIMAFFYDFSCQREQRSSLLGLMPSAAENGCKHFCKYMEENYNAAPEQLMLDWNNVGATSRFIGNGCNIQYRLWERSNGYLGIPDMTIIIYELSVADTVENAVALCQWTGATAKANGFLHIADIDRQPEDADNQVPNCQIACLTL